MFAAHLFGSTGLLEQGIIIVLYILVNGLWAQLTDDGSLITISHGQEPHVRLNLGILRT